MPKWEVWRIEEKVNRKGVVLQRYLLTYVAVTDTTGGQQVIDQSSEIQANESEVSYAQRREERAKLVGRLLANGWEPLETRYGQITAFRRQVS